MYVGERGVPYIRRPVYVGERGVPYIRRPVCM